MKRLLSILITLVLMLSFAAYAEETGVEVTHIPVDTDVEINLGGNEGFATVRWNKTTIDEYSEGMALSIGTESGAKIGWTTWTMEYLFNVSVWAADLDSDGLTEIFVSGDVASDDYYTYCLRCENGEIRQLPFADVERGSDYKGYTDYGYGMVTGFGENTVTLTGSQDMLGTRFAKRTFKLDGGLFVTADDGLWRFDIDLSDPDLWQYRSLNPVQPIPATFIGMGGDFEGTVFPGEKIMLTASDLKTTAHFITRDGRMGYLALSPNTENGWGSLISGIPEEDLFEYVPYAD